MAVFFALLPIISTFLLGQVLRYKKIVDLDKSIQFLGVILFKVIAPLLVFSTISTTNFETQWGVLLLGPIIAYIWFAVAVIIAFYKYKSNEKRGAFAYSVSSFAIASFIIPFTFQEAFSAVRPNIIAIDSLLFPSVFILFVPIISSIFPLKKISVRSLVKQMFSSYIFIAAIIGISVNITGLTLPVELLKSLDYFIRVFPFLAILYLSLQVDITLIIKRRIFGLMYLFRTSILLIAILLLGVILNLDKITITTLSLIFVAPFAPFMFGLSRDEGYDTSESGAMTSASMMWAIVVATLVTLVISIYA